MKLVALGLFVFGASIAGAQASDAVQAFTVKGTNPNGSPYGGTAWIAPTSDATCKIAWQTGSSTSEGFCMVSGDVLTAAYILGEVVGLVIYKIKPDGTLDGTWTIADKPGVGTEVLTPTN